MCLMSLFLLLQMKNIKKEEHQDGSGRDEGQIKQAADVVALCPSLTMACDRCDKVAMDMATAGDLRDPHL
jgi:hypothetical protein